MDIKVIVATKRKCFASVDWYPNVKDDDEHRDVWIMSFGDKNKPDTDVEVEFTAEQMGKLRNLLNKMYKDNKFIHEHVGYC